MGSAGTVLRRRSLLLAGAGLAAAAVTDRASGETATVNMQLGWLGGGNQLGEACAHQLGYFPGRRSGLPHPARRSQQ